MGTTDSALQAGSGQFGYALLIEGYPYVIHDGADSPAVVTAYAGTGWSQAHPGLGVIGTIKQSIEPLKPGLDIPTMTFHVLDTDGSDTFGKAVWKSKPTISSRLDAVFTPAADGSGTLTVKENGVGVSSFPSSGTVYLGTRTITYSSKSGSTGLVVPAAGANPYSPFAADGSNVYQRDQGLSSGQNWDVAAPPRVSNVPDTWQGKHVALYMHRIAGGVWDVRAQAHLEFAGTIGDIDDGEGVTVVTCQDIRKQVEDAVLLKRQFVGYVKPGINLRTGDQFYVQITAGDSVKSSSDPLTVVASGASGADEIDAGIYETEALLTKLNAWITADTSVAGDFTFKIEPSDAGMRLKLVGTITVSAVQIELSCTSHDVMEFLGFPDTIRFDDRWAARSERDYSASQILVSPQPPYRILAARPKDSTTGRSYIIEFDAPPNGEFFEGSAYYPAYLDDAANGEANWSYFRIGKDQLVLGKWDGTSKITSVAILSNYASAFRSEARGEEINDAGITYDEPGERLPVYQVVALAGKFSKLIPTLFASVSGAGVNHATYDVLPFGAGVPYSLLGSNFLASCASLETTGKTDSITVLLEKPTKLRDVLVPELALRFAFLIFKNGGLQFVSPQAPNSTTADYTLDETNKAGGPGEKLPMTSSRLTSDYLVNDIKINYERTTGDQPLEIHDLVSIDRHGKSEPITIDAVNSTAADDGASGKAVENMVGLLAATLFPMFGRPVKLLTRTLAPTLYGIAPGNTVTISDDLVRDPTTGERGISGRAGIVIESVHGYGQGGGRMMGEVTVLLTDEDRTFPLSAAAEIDTTYTSGLYTNGYDSTNFRLKLKDHSFSKSTDSKDAASFNHGDLIRIVELDPADPSTIDAWSRTLHASTGVDTSTGYLQMTASLSSPSYSGATKKLVVIPQAYTSVQASQKLHAFQADDADGMVLNTIEPNSYGSGTDLTFARGLATDLPVLLADESYGDGKPLTPYQLQYMSRMVNNLISYKAATHIPLMLTTVAGASILNTSVAAYTLMFSVPVAVGGFVPRGWLRAISIAPQFFSGGAHGTSYVRVTSSRFPPTGTALTDVVFAGATRSVVFTTTSATAVTATAQDLVIVPAQFPGHTWLTVEIKTTTLSSCNVLGFPICQLKPLVAL